MLSNAKFNAGTTIQASEAKPTSIAGKLQSTINRFDNAQKCAQLTSIVAPIRFWSSKVFRIIAICYCRRLNLHFDRRTP